MEMTEQQAEIKKLYLLGIENKSIAKMMGLTINQATQIIYKELGLQSKYQKLSIRLVTEVNRLRAEGLKPRHIMEKLQIPKSRLDYILKEKAA